MTVNGIEKRNVSIEVKPKECFRALCEELGVLDPIAPQYDQCFETITRNGKIVKLIEKKDFSRHGSPDYQPTGRTIEHEKTLAAYVHLRAINDLYHYL